MLRALVTRRAFFRELGIADCYETDVIIAIKQGVYTRQKYIEMASKRSEKPENVKFNE
jgi:hypothetical protein